MNVFLDRFKSDDNGTFGMMILEGQYLCHTCEDPWKNNAPNQSCIPAGKYSVVKYSSPKFPGVWRVENVPNRSGILIHNGNNIIDTEGCILVGDSIGYIDGLPSVLNSRKTLAMLKLQLPDDFDLTITGVGL
ncbi:DUF5675 family protein [Singulisphaera rosea]